MIDALAFWYGRWRVELRDGSPAGTNVIEPIVGGHAILEHWQSVEGHEGKSLFYYDAGNETWRQVWVQAGGFKEKTLVESAPGFARFEGTAFVGERTFPDRTTLRALENGDVEQLIEGSPDGGATWQTTFDAIYRSCG